MAFAQPAAGAVLSASLEIEPDGAAAPARIVLVDRDSLARRAMREELTATGEFVVVAEAAEEADAINAVRNEQPDLVLIDIGYPVMSGIAIAKELRQELPSMPIVFCSIAADEETAIRALSAGAVGYVRKDLDSGPLARALRGALAGEAAISRQLARRVLEELCRRPEPRPRLAPAGGDLTAREWEVLDLMIEGAGTAEIAESLDLAIETVRSHIKHVLRKLGVGTRGEAIAIARRLRARRN
jgi:DNA-binding NarL/FixJ family response regulator